MKTQLLALENQVRTQKHTRQTSVLDIVMALIIFFIVIPAILWVIVVAACIRAFQ